MSKYDVILIGSGISALTSAALLSKKGKKVLLLEQYSRPGGYMHSFRRFGELYDTGAHYVGALKPGQPFHTLLTYLDVFDESLFVPLDAQGFDVFHFPEGKIQFPAGYEEVISELGASFPNERSAIRQYFTMIREVVQYFPTYHFNPDTEMTRTLESLDTSLKSVVEKLTSDRRLQSVFYAYCSLHGVLPQDTPFGLHAIMVDSLLIGPMGFSQGGDGLVKKFIDRIQAQGGEVKTKHKVTSLVVKNDQISEVITENGQSFQAEWIISCIHPKSTFRLLSDQSRLTFAFKERMSNLKETDGIFGVYASCQNLRGLSPLQNQYYFQTSDPQQLFHVGRPEDPPPAVFASLSRSAKESNAGQILSLHSGAPYRWFQEWHGSSFGQRSEEYKKLKEVIAEGVFDLVGKYESNFRTHVDKYVTSSPLTNLHYNGSEEGSGYGIYHSIQNTGARALGPRTKILNLLLTGQNCLFPGLLGASVSALRSSAHIVGIKPILTELQALGNSQ